MTAAPPKPSPRAAAPANVAVVLPVAAVPGLVQRGAYRPGVTYTVAPDLAERLRARGFQLATPAGDTALPPPADAGRRGTPISQSDEE